MGRSPWVAVVCGIAILAGCLNDNDELQPIVSTRLHVSMDYSGCDGYGFGAGETPVTLRVKAQTVTTSCRCQHTTRSIGRSGSEECLSSEESPGGSNPDSCVLLEAVPEDVQVTATLDDTSRCSVVIRPVESSQSDVVVSCQKIGFVRVDVNAVVGATTEKLARQVEFRGTECPPR